MKLLAIHIIVALLPMLARAQGVILSPAPASQVDPANPSNYGVGISPYSPDQPTYGIDLNGDGIVDFTLTSTDHYQSFDIIPSGNNAVLSFLTDSSGSSEAANLTQETVIDSSTASSLSAVWQLAISNSHGTLYPNITAAYADGVQGQFAYASGFIGLETYVNGQIHYGFLQIDCLGYDGIGGFYLGYGYNTVAGQPITITSVPEPSVFALLAVSGMAFRFLRRNRLPS